MSFHENTTLGTGITWITRARKSLHENTTLWYGITKARKSLHENATFASWIWNDYWSRIVISSYGRKENEKLRRENLIMCGEMGNKGGKAGSASDGSTCHSLSSARSLLQRICAHVLQRLPLHIINDDSHGFSPLIRTWLRVAVFAWFSSKISKASANTANAEGFSHCILRGYFECRLEVRAKIADYKLSQRSICWVCIWKEN